MIPPFGHHLIPLLSLPGAVGALGGKAHLAAVKEACKSAERIHGALTMAGRFEIAVIPGIPDFFDPGSGMAKGRNLAWEMIRTTPRLQWVILTRSPENIPQMLPPTWIGKGFQNVCLGLVADGDELFSEKLEALRKAPVQHRMILVTSASQPIDINGQLDGIDWVVFAGNPDDATHVAAIEASCHESNVTFLFHQFNGGTEHQPTIGNSDDRSPWPAHPFGAKVQLGQPTLPDLKLMAAAHLKSSSPPIHADAQSVTPSTRATKSLDHPVESAPLIPASATEPPTEILPMNVIFPRTDEPPTAVSNTDHNDFTRLDGVVRRGLSTFIEVGQALAEIRDRELWRAGGHASWAAYCPVIGGLTKTHANRLINSSAVASHLTQVTPVGVTPTAESQVRPLCKLKLPAQQALAWSRATKLASGQPTARLISDVVATLMAEESPPVKSKPDRKQLLRDVISRLRKVIHTKHTSNEVERVIVDLEKFLKLV